MKKKILNYLRQKRKMSVTTKEMAEDLGLTGAKDFRELVKVLAVMESEALIDFTELGTIALHHLNPEIIGTFRSNTSGFGFVTVDPNEPDIFIGKGNTMSAMEGDEVSIIISKPANPLAATSAEGKVTQIKSHAYEKIVGSFFPEIIDTFIGKIKSRDKKMNWKILVSDKGLKANEGEVVAADILEFPNEEHPDTIVCLITKIIGQKAEKGIDVLEILETKGIKSDFPEELEKELLEISEEISVEDLKNREDFRAEITYTIDGIDAKDLDDAIHVKVLESGNYELGVHIADVSHYVKYGTALDKEAFERGTSVYVTDRVVPMLPEVLSNGICSLNPQVDRLTKSCIMEITREGRVVNQRIVSSVIKTTYRMTYADVNLMFSADEQVLKKFDKIADSVSYALKLHKILERMRRQRGALEFAENESKILVDENGLAFDIIKRERGLAERMIESFMLAANETVAEYYNRRHLPFIYRVHESPKVEKVQAFIDLASSFGLTIPMRAANIGQKELQEFSRKIIGQTYEPVLSKLMLRSMQQARYAAEELGHFGLAADFYSHFTSPIRRYPDLLAHRLITDYQEKDQEMMSEFWESKISDIAQHSSSRERRAVEAEREVEKMKKAEYMSAFIGEEFEGIVSSLTNFGLFVELENTVEGLIHLQNFKKEYLVYNERNLTLRSDKTGLTFRIGQSIRIKVTAANKVTGEIDFEYIKSDLDVFEKRVNIEKKKKERRRASPQSQEFSKRKKKNKQAFYKKIAKKQQKRKK
ncbi:MAG: ribonuclease R [Lactovum sp.]